VHFDVSSFQLLTSNMARGPAMRPSCSQRKAHDTSVLVMSVLSAVAAATQSEGGTCQSMRLDTYSSDARETFRKTASCGDPKIKCQYLSKAAVSCMKLASLGFPWKKVQKWRGLCVKACHTLLWYTGSAWCRCALR